MQTGRLGNCGDWGRARAPRFLNTAACLTPLSGPGHGSWEPGWLLVGPDARCERESPVVPSLGLRGESRGLPSTGSCAWPWGPLGSRSRPPGSGGQMSGGEALVKRVWFCPSSELSCSRCCWPQLESDQSPELALAE